MDCVKLYVFETPSGVICWSVIVPGVITVPPDTQFAPSHVSIASITVLNLVVPVIALLGL